MGARLLEGADTPMSREDCCNNGGGAWGLFGSNGGDGNCLVCVIKNGTKEGKLSEIAKGVDTPGGTIYSILNGILFFNRNYNLCVCICLHDGKEISTMMV